MVDSLRRKPDFARLSPHDHDILRGGVRRANDAEANWDGHRQEMSQLFHRMKRSRLLELSSVCRMPDTSMYHWSRLKLMPIVETPFPDRAVGQC
jgi:hypothetical protein